jgi:hypothetical protein
MGVEPVENASRLAENSLLQSSIKEEAEKVGVAHNSLESYMDKALERTQITVRRDRKDTNHGEKR